MALWLPPHLLPSLQSFLELSDERIQGFSDALAKAGSKFNTNDLAAEASKRTNVPRPIAEGVVQLVVALYTAREDPNVPLNTFLDEQVAPAVKSAFMDEEKRGMDSVHTADEVEARWAKLKMFLLVALTLDDTVGIAAKAGPVLTEHERIFSDARILTDVRLIFHPDLSEKPNAAVIVHMLRLTTRNVTGRQQQAQYFALDSNDIRFIKQLMDRAIKKEETLKSVMNSSGVNIIEPKGFF